MNYLLSDVVVDALSWVLAHSLWQVAIIGLLLSFFLPRFSNPQQRYMAAYSALLSILLAGIATFYWYLPLFQAEGHTATVLLTDLNTVAQVTVINDKATAPTGFWQNTLDWFDLHKATFVFIWLSGFLLLLVRMLGGLWYLQYLKKQAIVLNDTWKYLNELSDGLGIRQQVSILRTTVLRSPVTFGYFKPVVLLPIALINQLNPEEVEAIVLHELAHIARRDWLMQLVQTIVEALFYFHPVVWWLSSVIRHERERCSDELAVSLMPHNRIAYARALLRVQEYAQSSHATPALALAATGNPSRWFQRRTYLLERVQIILLQSSQQKSMLMERMLISGLLVATLTLWGLKAAPIPDISAAATGWFTGFDLNESEQMPTDSIIPRKSKSVQRISEDDGKQKVEIEIRNGIITQLSIDGKDIPKEDYERHEELLDRLWTETPQPPARPELFNYNFPSVPPVPPVPGVPPVPPVPGVPPVPPVPAIGYYNFNNASNKVYVDKADKDNTVIRLDGDETTEISIKNGKVTINGKEVGEGESVNIRTDGNGYTYFNSDLENFPAMQPGQARVFEDQMRAHEDQMRKHKAEMRQHESDMRKHDAEMLINDAEMAEYQAKIDAKMDRVRSSMTRSSSLSRESLLNAATEDDLSSAFLEALKKDGLITDTKEFSYSLRKRRFKINGKRQSDEIHQKYMNLYRTLNANAMGDNDGYEVEVKR
jgi:beta-lactamase regulating signal transducer with metallopeptidase domain